MIELVELVNMKTSIIAKSLAMLAVGQVAANAAVITQHVTGYISGSSTVDAQGYFGAAGTDLNGKPFEVFFQYTTDDFVEGTCTVPPGSYPGSTCDNHVSKPGASNTGGINDSATHSSVLILMNVNGVRRSFAPFKQGAVSTFNSPMSLGTLEGVMHLQPVLLRA